ncbi:unnamed protein product [Allacma fusca]|uniref:DNA polymerase delta subunit 3 n=1 Tax=Allacma fusca TaxID=39272 RepID=A0A8J2JQU5_9HEXA|nr:unnamed protein product [Allacma fusca]
MIKTDDLYLDNLKEFVYDDKKVVTYKFLSVYLGVHVNLAKQMLYTFREREKKAGKKIYSLLYVSGLTSKGVGSQDSDDSPGDDGLIEKHIILLCKDSDFDAIKDKFSKLLSVHVYCVSSFPIEDYASLQSIVKKPVEINEQTPSDFGPFTCNNDLKPNNAKVTVTTASDPPPPKVKEEARTESKEPEPEASKKPPVKVQNQSKSKNFFGTQSQAHGSSGSKSVTKKTPNQSSIQSSMSKMKPSVKTEKTPVTGGSKNGNTTSAGKKHQQGGKSQQKSRKRIRLNSDSDSDNAESNKIASVFTSSEDEDAASDDSQESPQSKRKSRIVSSDSEEEIVEEDITSPQDTVTEESKVNVPRKKRVMKTIDKTYTDDEGFLVTKKETVVVTDPEDSNTEMECDVKPEENKPKNGTSPDVVKSMEHVHTSKEQKSNGVPAKKATGLFNGKTTASMFSISTSFID